MKNLLLKITLAAAFFALMSTTQTLEAQCIKNSDGEYVLPDGSPCPNAIITAVPFLRIVSDARSGAMGDAGIALSPDANAMHFNQSKLVFAENDLGMSATYTPWLRALGLNDVYLAYLTGFYKINDFTGSWFRFKIFLLGRN